MSNDQPSRRTLPGKSGGGAPMGSTVSIVIAVIAVVVGFLVLRNINDSDAGSTGNETDQTLPTTPTGGTDDIVVDPSSTVADSTATTAAPVFDAAQQVVVANAAGIGGAAGNYTKALQTAGWTMGTPADATAVVDVSVVYYLAGGEAVAASVAAAMSDATSTIAATAMPTPAPIQGGLMPAGATVLVLLGKDRAGKALPANAGTTTNTTIVQAPLDSSTSSSVAG